MLGKKFNNKINYKGGRVNLTLSFNNVINFYSLQEDERFTNAQKIEWGYNLICKSRKKYTHNEKVEILELVFEEHVNVINLKGNSSNKKAVDFSLDSGYIYASFMDQYNIDLYDLMDQLDWRKFIYLFHGLGDKTIIKRIMSIRTMDIPKTTKNNQKEIESILELKTMYALEISESNREKSLAEALKGIVARYT